MHLGRWSGLWNRYIVLIVTCVVVSSLVVLWTEFIHMYISSCGGSDAGEYLCNHLFWLCLSKGHVKIVVVIIVTVMIVVISQMSIMFFFHLQQTGMCLLVTGRCCFFSLNKTVPHNLPSCWSLSFWSNLNHCCGFFNVEFRLNTRWNKWLILLL